MSKLSYFKLMLEDFETMAEIYSTAQIGELIVATMQYLKDGRIVEIEEPLKYAYLDLRKKVDRSQKAYEEKCAQLAKNGAKGGKAKAANRYKCSKSHFKQMITKIADEIDEDIPPASFINDLYEELKENNFSIGGEPLANDSDLDSYLYHTVFRDNKYDTEVFEYVFSKYHGLRDEEGKTQASEIAFDSSEIFKKSHENWKKMIDEYIAEHYLANASKS